MTDNSGAAYPLISGEDVIAIGLTKREYFEGQALAGILAGGFADTIPHDDIEGGATVASFACMYADALIAALTAYRENAHDR
jgi:hypothetical protein